MAGEGSPPAPSDAELEPSPGFKIESHWAIVHKLDTWYPEVVTRNGDNFVKLSKFDRKFVLFALGQAYGLVQGCGTLCQLTHAVRQTVGAEEAGFGGICKAADGDA